MRLPISVLICTYNSGDFLRQSLKSLEDQTLSSEDFEVIIVDDGSTDNTEEVINIYRDTLNLSVMRNETNFGLAKSCNRGLNLAKGEYFVRLDADDCFVSSALEDLLKAVDSTRSDLIYSDHYTVDFYSKRKRLVKKSPFNLYKLIAVGTLMRRSIVDCIGGFRDLFWEEYDLFIRFLDFSKKPPFYINKPLVEYYFHCNNMTLDKTRVRQAWQQLIQAWGIEKLRRYGTCPAMEKVYKELGQRRN